MSETETPATGDSPLVEASKHELDQALDAVEKFIAENKDKVAAAVRDFIETKITFKPAKIVGGLAATGIAGAFDALAQAIVTVREIISVPDHYAGDQD